MCNLRSFSEQEGILRFALIIDAIFAFMGNIVELTAKNVTCISK